MEIITGIIKESYHLFYKMAPYLVFGYLFAGVLHIFVRTETVSRHLGKSSVGSVVKASLFGIPLPLCSCSVIPAAMSLRKEGASRGAVLSFLISTPTTGVDSIFATYSLLGGLFTIYRVIASFVTGVLSGIVANLLIKEERKEETEAKEECHLCEGDSDEHSHEGHNHSMFEKIKGVFTYAFVDLLEDTGLALVVGIIIGGAISFFLPEDFIATYLGAGLGAMLVMLLVGIPMYVCATASIPIAAALMLKGLEPGAAFVFLVAGPATNIVTMSVVAKNIGKAALAIYLGSIAISSIGLGLVLNIIFEHFYTTDSIRYMVHQRELVPDWASFASCGILILMIAYNIVHTHLIKGKG